MIDTATLHPFVSVQLIRARDDADLDTLVRRLLRAFVDLYQDRAGQIELVSQPHLEEEGVFITGAAHFAERRPPPWTSDPGISDYRNHIVVICQLVNYLAIHISDDALERAFIREVGGVRLSGLAEIELVDVESLNATFISGRTKTLWLTGTHPRTSLKSDSKMLSGLDLKDALNPLEDQSYHFTAARSDLDDPAFDVPVGISPSKSRLWLRRSANWSEYNLLCMEILTRLAENTRRSFAPLPYLAISGDGGEVVHGAFDLGFYSPPSAGQGNNDPWVIEAQRLADEFHFEVIAEDGPNLTAHLLRRDQLIGRVLLTFDLSDPNRVECYPDGEPEAVEYRQEVADIVQHFRSGEMLIVRYDSEHVIANNQLIRLRYRHYSFHKYHWQAFDGYDVTREKPHPLTAIGTQDSLFCWIKNVWYPIAEGPSGWLLCDDGSGEVADFVHLDDSFETLTLIHVKAADSGSPKRGVAVTPFEVVASQAVKNLRHLDTDNLSARLADRIETLAGALCWKDGALVDRDQFIAALSQLKPTMRRRVVILQPHLLRSVWEEAVQQPGTIIDVRRKQLDSLMISTEISFNHLGAELHVLCAT